MDTFVLWDIDGTVSVHGKSPLWSGEWCESVVTRTEIPHLFEHIPEKFQELTVRVNQSLLDQMTAFHNESKSVNMWHTAWREHAVTSFSRRFDFHVGEEWPLFTSTETNSTDDNEKVVWWKIEAVRNFLKDNPGSRIIWIDDLFDDTERIESDCKQLVKDFSDRIALIGVVSHVGVTPDVFNFVRRISDASWTPGMFLWE